MLTMIRTEPARSELFSDVISHTSNNDELYDHFSCPNHPGFKLQVYCPKENLNPSLMCIKCLIDPEIERRIKGEPLIAIQDVVNKGTSAKPREAISQLSRNGLREKILDFSSKDYLGVFESHTDTQMKKLQREIERVKESLDELQSQFKQLFDKQYKHLKEKEDELKIRINEYLEDEEQIENLIYSSPEEVMETIRKTNSIKEYERIIKVLFHRGSPNQKVITSAMMSRIFEIMDDLKEKVNKMRSCKIQTSILDDIRLKIESIEILDQSFQTLPTNLNPKLMETLEKIRMNEERRKTPQKTTGYQLAEKIAQKRADFLGPLKERLANFGNRDSTFHRFGKQMEVETISRFGSGQKATKMNEKDYSDYSHYKNYYGIKTEEKERVQKKGKESATQTVNFVNAYTSTNHDNDYYRHYDEDQVHRRQKTDAYSYRRVDDRRRRETEMSQEEYYEDFGDRNHSADYPLHEEYATENSVEPQPRVKSNKTKTNSSSTKNKSKNDNSNQKSSKKRVEDGQSNSQNHRDSSLDDWIKQDQKKKYREKDQDRMEKDTSKKNKAQTDGDDDLNDARGSETDNSNTNTPKRAKVRDLHDWINRRVTGYLIFQNTMQGGGLEKESEKDHLNRVAGDKWKGLTKAEREEYRSLAMNARVQLKREIRNVGIDDFQIKELQELIEKKIKKVKKASSDDDEGNEL